MKSACAGRRQRDPVGKVLPTADRAAKVDLMETSLPSQPSLASRLSRAARDERRLERRAADGRAGQRVGPGECMGAGGAPCGQGAGSASADRGKVPFVGRTPVSAHAAAHAGGAGGVADVMAIGGAKLARLSTLSYNKQRGRAARQKLCRGRVGTVRRLKQLVCALVVWGSLFGTAVAPAMAQGP